MIYERNVCEKCGAQNSPQVGIGCIGKDREADYDSNYYNGFEGFICTDCLNNGFDGKINETTQNRP